jgi:hypothetical protein
LYLIEKYDSFNSVDRIDRALERAYAQLVEKDDDLES